jgi:RNA polymerase sigma factor (sigma-70 family)
MMSQPTTRPSLLFRLRDPLDHEAWVEFVTLYEPVVYRLLRRHGLQDADAREVMQEVFLAVNRSIERWNPEKEHASFRSWLSRVARNLMVNLMVRRNRGEVATGDSKLMSMLDQLPALSGPESTEFDLELGRAQFRGAADRVQRQVQPSSWQAFWDICVTGASAEEVATKLGMHVGAVRVAKCRVLARLRVEITRIEQGT